MKLLAADGADVRACDLDGPGHEAALAQALQRLRSRSADELHALTGGSALVDLAQGAGSLAHTALVEDRTGPCLDGLDVAVSFSATAGNVEVFRRGDLAPTDVVLEAAAREHSPRLVDPGRLAAALAEGYTVRLNGVDRTAPAVGELARLLELAAATSVNANAYLTGADVAGAVAHVDSHDVVIVQLVGSKAWRCGAPPSSPPPGVGADIELTAVAWTGSVVAGDVLTLPRGTVHEPHPDGSMSIHLSFGVRRPAASEILAQAVASDRALFADVGQALLDDGDGASAQALVEELRATDPAPRVAGILSRHRYRQPIRRTISVALHQHAMQHPADYQLRWSAPGGVVVPVGDRPAGTVGVASQLLELDDGDFDPFLRLLSGERVGVEGWARTSLGEESFRGLVQAGICEPVPRAR